MSRNVDVMMTGLTQSSQMGARFTPLIGHNVTPWPLIG